MKIIKALFSLIVFIILLLVVAAIALPHFFDPNDYKEEISTAAKEHTGLDLSIEGDLSLSVFPWIGVNTGRITLSQPASIRQSTPTAGPFIDVEAIDVKVKLKPLLSRQVEIDTILLKKPRIELITDKKGHNSLDGLASAAGDTSNPQTAPKNTNNSTQTTPTSSNNNEAKAIAALTIAGINITDGHIIIDDQPNNTRHQVKSLTITSGNVLGGSAAPFSVSGELHSTDMPPVTLTLDSQLQFDQEQFQVAVSNLALSVQQASTYANANIDNIRYDHQKALATITGSQFEGRAEDIPFTMTMPSINVDMNNTAASIASFSVQSLGVDVSGKLHVSNWDKDINATGNILVAPFNAHPLLKKFAIDYVPTHKNALTSIGFSSDFSGTSNSASLKNTVINIDQTQLTGDVNITHFAQPKYRFDLSLNSIVIDDYLPVEEKPTTKDTTPAEPINAAEALAAPIVLLKDIYANGTFRAKKITASNIVLENNVISVVSNQQKVVIKPALDLYEGKLNGTISLARTAKPTLSIVTQLKQVNLEPLLIAADITDQFSGIGNLSTNITVKDNNGKPSSKGSIKVAAKNGAIKGIDIKKILDDAQATIDKLRRKETKASTDASTEDTTRFAEMTATLLLDNDIITNNDLSMKAPAFRIKGDGTVNLAKQTVDYLTSVVVVNTNAGQGGKDKADLKGITIPVRFTGSLTAPKYKIDTRALLKANTKKSVDKNKDKLKNKLLDKLGVDTSTTNTDAQAAAAKEKAKDDLKEKLKKKLFDKLF